MTTLPLGVVCVVIVALATGVDGRIGGNSYSLLGSLMNTANAAVSQVRTRVNQIQEKKQPNEPSLSSGPMLLDMMCSLCKEKNDIECIKIHCTHDDTIPMMPVPARQTDEAHQRNMEKASQLSRHERLHNNKQSTFPSRINTGTNPQPWNPLPQTTPLPWTQNTEVLNRSPSETRHTFQLPSQENVNGQAGFPTTGINPFQPHNPFERQRVFEQMINFLFSAQQILKGQTQRMPLFPRQPSLATNQHGLFPSLNFNPALTEQTNNRMPQQEVTPTHPGGSLSSRQFDVHSIDVNQQTSNRNTQSVPSDNSMGGQMNTGWGDNLAPIVPDSVPQQVIRNQHMPQIQIDTPLAGSNQQSAFDGNTGIPLSWRDTTRTGMFNGNQQSQPSVIPDPSEQNAGIPLSWRDTRTGMFNGNQQSQPSVIPTPSEQNAGIPLAWDETRTGMFNGNQPSQHSTTPNVMDTNDQFNGTPTPDIDIFPVPLPTPTINSNGVSMTDIVVPLPGEILPNTGSNNQQSTSVNLANLVVPLPGENFPVVDSNNQQASSINSGEQIGQELLDVPQVGQGFLPDGFVEWDATRVQQDQSRPRHIDISVAQDIFPAPNEAIANPSQFDTMSTGFQNTFPSMPSADVLPPMQTFEVGSQVIRESLTDIDSISTHIQPTLPQEAAIDTTAMDTMIGDPISLSERHQQDNGRWPVDLRATIVTPFDDEPGSQQPEMPTRNDIFLDLGHGGILTQPQNAMTIDNSFSPVELNNANLLDDNPSSTVFINNPSANTVANSNSGQDFNNGNIDNVWLVSDVNNVDNEQNIAMSHANNGRQTFSSPQIDSSARPSGLMSMAELNAIIARNQAAAVQSSNGQIGPTQTQDIPVSVSRTRPVSLEDHTINAQGSVANMHSSIHIPQQNVQFVNTAQETLSGVPVEVMDTATSSNGMDLSGIEPQQFQTQNFETTTRFSTILPTIAPPRKSELNNLAGQWLRDFRLK